MSHKLTLTKCILTLTNEHIAFITEELLLSSGGIIVLQSCFQYALYGCQNGHIYRLFVLNSSSSNIVSQY